MEHHWYDHKAIPTAQEHSTVVLEKSMTTDYWVNNNDSAMEGRSLKNKS